MKKKIAVIAIVCALVITLSGAPTLAKRPLPEGGQIEKIQSFLDLYGNYLNVSEKWVQMVSAKETTVYLVMEKTVEIYEEKGEEAKAVPELRKLLSKYGGNATIRNMIHFKIAEIYKDTGQTTEALDELAAIVKAGR
jgi:predicted negative regulator of RcsB-dependent stress response